MSVAREASESPGNPPTAPLVSAGHSDRCPVCGAHLAVDQRYCVECGTRRGAARFSLASSTVGAATASASPPPPRSGVAQRLTRWTSGASLLLGLLILLVALGIGVLIGHNGNTKVAGQPKVNVTLNGGGTSGAASSGAATSASTGSGSSASSSTSSKAKKTTTKPAAANPKAAAKGKAATKSAAKSFAPTATKKSTLGGSCTPGTAGCKAGKQTGNLF